ncbi:MAG TPA: alpha/beta hydrolase [Polaromonas sp.]|uniref:alpha/beta hydrolase n=1 Tax=Polaromonas sp. TaxID=1869339 RepID=UPI002D3973FA|nr:alpha/beta hydrolase [Polaromonas sp.]HYW57303.1 alpha/beta hydrolase [Polaromonas sp.]
MHATNLKDPRRLLTPAMRDVLARMVRAGHAPIHTLSAQQARAAYEAGANVLEVSTPPLARVENFTIATRDGYDLPLRLYAPSHACLPVLLYFHGGGFTIGSVASHDILCRQLSQQAGCSVISVDYRLAPEHKFPIAANDAWDALAWLSFHADEKGLDGTRLAIGGDSAGGTLAAACAVQARDAALPLELQLLFYPGCAARQDSVSHQLFAKGFVLEVEHMRYFFGQYLRTPADRDDWRFSPLNAPDVDGVAPAWLGLAECDPLVDEGVLYADKLRAAGVAVDLEIYRGVTHEFIKMGRIIPEARQAVADAARAIRKAFDKDSHP